MHKVALKMSKTAKEIKSKNYFLFIIHIYSAQNLFYTDVTNTHNT